MYTVYILRSLKDRKHYIGYTENFDRRLQEHNRGSTKSLKGRIPVVLIYSEQYLTKTEARKREREIKSYKGGNAFKALLGQ